MKNDKEWSGYTLDELRFQRMLTLTRIEMERSAIKAEYQQAANPNPKVQSLAQKVSNSIGYINYALIGYKIFKRISSFFKK